MASWTPIYMQVGAHLYMQSTEKHKASFKRGEVGRRKSHRRCLPWKAQTFDEDLDADLMQVGAHLIMRSTEQNKASFKGVILDVAKVAGEVFMDDAIGTEQISMVFARIGGSLDIRGTTLAELDLSGAIDCRGPAVWQFQRAEHAHTLAYRRGSRTGQIEFPATIPVSQI